jgi:hypothetical protein
MCKQPRQLQIAILLQDLWLSSGQATQLVIIGMAARCCIVAPVVTHTQRSQQCGQRGSTGGGDRYGAATAAPAPSNRCCTSAALRELDVIAMLREFDRTAGALCGRGHAQAFIPRPHFYEKLQGGKQAPHTHIEGSRQGARTLVKSTPEGWVWSAHLSPNTRLHVRVGVSHEGVRDGMYTQNKQATGRLTFVKFGTGPERALPSR